MGFFRLKKERGNQYLKNPGFKRLGPNIELLRSKKPGTGALSDASSEISSFRNDNT